MIISSTTTASIIIEYWNYERVFDLITEPPDLEDYCSIAFIQQAVNIKLVKGQEIRGIS